GPVGGGYGQRLFLVGLRHTGHRRGQKIEVFDGGRYGYCPACCSASLASYRLRSTSVLALPAYSTPSLSSSAFSSVARMSAGSFGPSPSELGCWPLAATSTRALTSVATAFSGTSLVWPGPMRT